MKRIGIIDIGSNSLGLVLIHIHKDYFFQIIDEVKETVRLGENLGKEKMLQTKPMESAFQTLKMFKNLCDSLDINEIIAVATEAVRSARNKNDFIKKIKQEMGIHISVLSGQEEAHYAYLSVIHSIDIDNGLIMDMGGSSTEIILMKDKKKLESISLPFGAITLAQKFNISNTLEKKEEKALIQFLKENFKHISWLRKEKLDTLIGIGGTLRSIGKIDKKKKEYPMDILHNYKIRFSEVSEIYHLTKSEDLEERKKIKGLSEDRADIFIGVAATVTTLMDFCKLKRLVISEEGLREGLLYNYLQKNKELDKEILDYSIHNFLMSHQLNISHALQVYKLFFSLYEQLQEPLQLKKDMYKIIKTAAMLHDAGIAIGYYDHHKHSFYMILHSELKGLTHKELLMSAYIAASHEKKHYKIDPIYTKLLLSKEDAANIKKLSLLLCIAESLDKGMNGAVKEVYCTFKKNVVNIKVICPYALDLEIKDAMKIANSFKDVYGKNLIIN